MARVPGKGTLFRLTISSTLTTIGQVIELDSANDETETFDGDYLDNTDEEIPVQHTGRVSRGDISGTMFYDPDLATHQFITDILEDPGTLLPLAGSIVLADATPASVTFNLKGISMGLSVRMNDGVKAPFSCKVNDKVWPT
jgi:hypothetical protein